MRIGILGTSEIAFRRFLPALEKCDMFSFAGVASRDVKKTVSFIASFGGKAYVGYDALLCDESVDCVYIPLPPALHFEWAMKALEAGKHVLLEKPFTTTLSDSILLLNLGQDKDLALHENYMFQYHNQIDWIRNKLPDLGELRLIRLDFGFPFRGSGDFRYDKVLGGGALLDCGVYPLKLALFLLGDMTELLDAWSGYKQGFDVDIYGSATLRNADGLTAQVSFGMDNSYRCFLEIWGSLGRLYTNRIFTAPDSFTPTVYIETADGVSECILEADDCFAKSILHFARCVNDKTVREYNYTSILKQAEVVERFMEMVM